MGLFDFLKKKQQTKPVQQADESIHNDSIQNKPKAYLGDLDKTKLLYDLVETPESERDENWKAQFLETIKKASFRCGTPQVIQGPDGFPYFQLFLPKPNEKFECFVIDNMKDDFLLESGFGVVINPSENGADWVLTSGDILNLKLNNTFYNTDKTSFSKETGSETVGKNEEVMIGSPSESLLPKQTRNVIAEFLKMNGVVSPKIVLMMRRYNDGSSPSQDLAFNLTPKNFPDEDTYRAVMQSISWFLPRHYSYVAMDEASLTEGFLDL